MAWTAPATWVADTILTAAQLNQQLRDNMSETGPAKIGAAGQILVGTAANTLIARTPGTGYTSAGESTASTSYTDLTTPGPTYTVTTGTSSLIILTAFLRNNTVNAASKMSFDISGATTTSASDTYCLLHISATTNAAVTCSSCIFHEGMTGGSNTFTAKYRVDAGTGYFQYRRIAVLPL